jgi:hypothetical protein
MYNYTPTTCKTTTDENLGWIGFANIFNFINASVFTYEHALNKFFNLTHFLFLGLNIRKIREYHLWSLNTCH